jgi:hypothetical protein
MSDTPLGLSEIKNDSVQLKFSKWFLRFADQTQGSPIYQFLSKKISEDKDLLEIASQSDPNQPAPNLFLAAIHYLLLKDPTEKLAKFYPSMGGLVENYDALFIEFKEFALRNASQIIAILRSKLVQTNEVQRCALLLPALNYVSNSSNFAPMALIDVGVSGGLNFLVDQVHVKYSDGSLAGPKDSILTLNCRVDGEPLPKVHQINIKDRIGIDLNPINLKDANERIWNLALIWPDQTERFQRFTQAVDQLQGLVIDFHRGSGNDLIESVIKGLPSENSICVMHSFTFNQFSQKDRDSFENSLKELSLAREIWRISLEWIGTPNPELVVMRYALGNKVMEIKLAECHGHGEWIRWSHT